MDCPGKRKHEIAVGGEARWGTLQGRRLKELRGKRGWWGWQGGEETEGAYTSPLSDGLRFEGGRGPCQWNGPAGGGSGGRWLRDDSRGGGGGFAGAGVEELQAPERRDAAAARSHRVCKRLAVPARE